VELLTWLENNSLVTWVRESDSLFGYTLYLAGHTIGMVCLLGPNLLIAARVLGLSPQLPLKPITAFRPLMIAGAWITLITGAVLFATAPIGYLRNAVFVVKILALIAALFCVRSLWRELFAHGDPDARPISVKARSLTWISLLLWTVGVVAGRLTAYSLVVVFESLQAFLVLLTVVGVAVLIARLMRQRPARERTETFTIEIHPTPIKGAK
jgi:hypothetical protein